MKKPVFAAVLLGLLGSGSALAAPAPTVLPMDPPAADFSALWGDFYAGNTSHELAVPLFTRTDTDGDGVFDVLNVRFALKPDPDTTLFTSPAVKVAWPTLACAASNTTFTTPRFLASTGIGHLYMAIQMTRSCTETGEKAVKTFVYSADLSNSPVKTWAKSYNNLNLLAFNFNANGAAVVVTGWQSAGGTALQPGMNTYTYVLEREDGAPVANLTSAFLR